MHEASTSYDQASRLRHLAASATGRQEEHSQSLIVAVANGKGGVGKSTVVANLALTLARQQKRVLMVDGSINLGSLDLLCGVSPKYRLDDLFLQRCRLTDAIVRVEENLWLLAGNSGDAYVSDPSNEQIVDLVRRIQHASPSFDIILIDTASGLTPQAISFGAYSDMILFVVLPEPTSVMAAYAMAKIVHATGSGTVFSVVVNDSDATKDFQQTAEKLQEATHRFLSRSILSMGSIPHDDGASQAVVQQQPLVKITNHEETQKAYQNVGFLMARQLSKVRGEQME